MPTLLAHIEEALDRLLMARMALAGLDETQPPADALDAALRRDSGYSKARREFALALEELRPVLEPEHRKLFLRIEERANALSSAASDVGFRVGLTARSG